MAEQEASDTYTGRLNAREIAQRNRRASDRALSPVMKTAATARELAHAARDAARERD